MKFVCIGGYYLAQPRKCEKIPDNMIYDEIEGKLKCKTNLYQIKNIGCVPKPEFMIYNEDLQIFECEKGTHQSKGVCRKPFENEYWSTDILDFACVEGSYRIK